MSELSLSGRLRHQIVIEESVETADGQGGFTTGWQNFATVWAEVKAVRSAGSHEAVQDHQVQGVDRYRFTIRPLAGVTSKMRISYDSRLFNIRSVLDLDGTGRFLEILAEEGVAT